MARNACPETADSRGWRMRGVLHRRIRSDSGHDQSTERFEHHIPMPRQEKRWHEMPVQKPLIREDGACEECCTGESDRTAAMTNRPNVSSTTYQCRGKKKDGTKCLSRNR